jgi:hypothetical protein
MAGSAFLGEDFLPREGIPLPLRQIASIGVHIDIPRRDFLGQRYTT